MEYPPSKRRGVLVSQQYAETRPIDQTMDIAVSRLTERSYVFSDAHEDAHFAEVAKAGQCNFFGDDVRPSNYSLGLAGLRYHARIAEEDALAPIPMAPPSVSDGWLDGDQRGPDSLPSSPGDRRDRESTSPRVGVDGWQGMGEGMPSHVPARRLAPDMLCGQDVDEESDAVRRVRYGHYVSGKLALSRHNSFGFCLIGHFIVCIHFELLPSV